MGTARGRGHRGHLESQGEGLGGVSGCPGAHARPCLLGLCSARQPGTPGAGLGCDVPTACRPPLLLLLCSPSGAAVWAGAVFARWVLQKGKLRPREVKGGDWNVGFQTVP